MRGKSAVITGATGHIGSTVANLLLDKGYAVTLLVRRLTPNVLAMRDRGATIHLCNLLKPETYQPVLIGKDVLFHLAAENTTDSSDEARVIQASLGLTEIVVATALFSAIPTVIYTSSVVVLGRSANKATLLDEYARVSVPESPYVKGKLLAEEWVAGQVKNGADIRRVYPSWVIGPGNPNLTPPHKFIKDFASKGQAFFFEGGVSIAHVQDVAIGHVLAYEKGAPRGQYVLSGDNVTFKELYDQLAEVFGQKKPTVKIPKWLIFSGATILGPISPVQASYVESVIGRYSWYSSKRAQTDLGYTSRPLRSTLEDVMVDIQRRITGTLTLRDQGTPALINSDVHKGVLLITGFPGWLSNRIVDILINGDELGRNKTSRKVRLLVQPHMANLVPPLPPNFEVVLGDITDKASLVEATKGVSAVWHSAGVIYPNNIELFERVNKEGTRNLADACIENNVRRFLYMSTDSTCGYTPETRLFTASEPANPYKGYGKSKYAGEEYITQLTAQFKLEATTFRAFWFFGPNIPERNLAFFRSFLWPFQLVFGNGRNRRSISHCDDLANAFVLAEDSPHSIGKWYWLPTFTQPQTVDEIYHMISDGLGKKSKLKHIPNIVCDLADWVDTLLTKYFNILNPTIQAAGKFHKTIATDANGAMPAFTDFGWKPEVTKKQIQKEIADSLANS